MKTRILLLMALSMSVLAVYGQQPKSSSAATKQLIVYFSRSNNTETIANYIKDATDADIIRIEPAEAYSPIDSICGARVAIEIANDIRPEIKTKIANLQDYDVIFVGSPLWQGSLSSPVKTLLSSYDFSGKTIVPFITCGSQGLGHSIDDIKKLIPQSTLLEGKAIKASDVKDAKNDVTKWLNEIKIIK